MDRSWETWGTHDLGDFERQWLGRWTDDIITEPREAKPVTWADIAYTMGKLGDAPPPRELHCGRAAWEILHDVSDKTTDVLGLGMDHLNPTGLYGTPVRIRPDMPDGAWKILEGDRVVIEGDFAPGHRYATFVPGVGLVAFNPPSEEQP